MAHWADLTPAELPVEAEAIVEECGRLPLALSLAGAQIRDGAGWADLLVAAAEDPERRGHVERTFLEAVASGEMDAGLAFEGLLIIGSPAALDLDVDLEGTLFENRLPELVWSNWAVDLRQDPRFKAWVRALGYERYWRQFGWPDRCKPCRYAHDDPGRGSGSTPGGPSGVLSSRTRRSGG